MTRHSRHHALGRSFSASRTVVVDTIGGYRPDDGVLLDLGLGPNVPVYSAGMRNFFNRSGSAPSDRDDYYKIMSSTEVMRTHVQPVSLQTR